MSVINTANELFNVNGLVALITGGGSGLGLYAARALDANGAKAVYIVGRRKETLEQAAKTAKNGTIIPIVGDALKREDLERIAAQIAKEQGHLNLLFANAGIVGPKFNDAMQKKGDKPTVSEWASAVLTPSMDDFTQTYHTNATAALYTVASFLELLDAGNKQRNVAQDSQVILTSSVAGSSRQIAAGLSYSLSKVAVTHLGKMLSTAFNQNGFHIRANVIAPGFYPSEMTESMLRGVDKWSPAPGHEKAFVGAHQHPEGTTPAGRSGSEQDFAGIILFLASQAGAFINGEVLLTDGGRISILPANY